MKTEDIDAAIDKLENNMAHTSMTLNEEKKIIAQISELRKSKAMVKELLESSGGKVDPAARETLEAQLKSVGAKITERKAQEQEQRKIMDEIKAKMGETKDEVPDLIKQKNNQWEIVKRCKETIGNLWDEHRKVENEYWTKEKAWRAQAKEERQKKWEAEQEERKKRDIERKQRQLDEAGEPFDREVTTCEQLTSYLKSLTKEETKVEETKSAPKVEEGMVVLKKKNDESEMDSWFTGSKGKKKGGKKKAAKSDKLVHSMDIISSFATLGLTAPPSKDAKGISDLVDKLEAKKAEYLEKRKDAHVKRAAQKEKIAKELEAATNGTEEKAEEKANGEANGEANGKEEGEAKSKEEGEAKSSLKLNASVRIKGGNDSSDMARPGDEEERENSEEGEGEKEALKQVDIENEQEQSQEDDGQDDKGDEGEGKTEKIEMDDIKKR